MYRVLRDRQIRCCGLQSHLRHGGRVFRAADSDEGLTIPAELYSLSLPELSKTSSLRLSSWKMFPRSLGIVRGKLSERSFTRFQNLGYCVEWMVHNSARFGVPQSRRRTYIVGYLGERNPLEILAFGTQYKKNIRLLINGGLQGRRVYLTSGDAVTQCSGSGGGGGKTGLYLIDQNPNPQITDNARCITARQDSGLIGPEGI